MQPGPSDVGLSCQEPSQEPRKGLRGSREPVCSRGHTSDGSSLRRWERHSPFATCLLTCYWYHFFRHEEEMGIFKEVQPQWCKGVKSGVRNCSKDWCPEPGQTCSGCFKGRKQPQWEQSRDGCEEKTFYKSSGVSKGR